MGNNSLGSQTADAGTAEGSTGGLDEPIQGSGWMELFAHYMSRWKLLVFGPLCVGLLVLGVTYLIPPTFTSRTVFLPPQQQQSLASSALASLGALSGLAGATAGIRSPIDQYVSLLQSTTVTDRIIDSFNLMAVYDKELRVDARKRMTKSLRVTAGRRDGLITIEFDDEDPKRAADVANAMVDELRRLTASLALTEAQQRRVFFEGQLASTKERLASAQRALQQSGYSPGALKAEPRAAAETYAKLSAELTAAEVRLQSMRRNLADAAPEVQQQAAVVAALKQQLSRLETSSDSGGDADYVGKYREFKYQEALFELFSRQYEVSRLDESREGSLIQVIDVAKPAERKTSPRRGIAAIVATSITFLLLVAGLAIRYRFASSTTEPTLRQRWGQLRAASAQPRR